MKVINNDIIDKVIDFWRNGAEPPLSLGMGAFNEYYGLKMGTVTDITGYPYSGKTLLLKEILVNGYLKHKLKQCLYLPDDGDTLEIIANLTHKLSGKTFDKKYKNNLTENEVYRFTTQILNDFVIVSDDNNITPVEFWEKSIELGCQTASIDSWNVMSHPDAISTAYLAKTLSTRNRLAQVNNVHFFTVIHPKNPTSVNYDKSGKLKEPSAFDLMGGSEWNNNGKNIIVVHKQEREGIEYEIHIKKTKPRIVGMTGMVKMNFDIPSQRFYEDNGFDKNYFFDNGFKEEQPKIITPNVSFDMLEDEAPF